MENSNNHHLIFSTFKKSYLPIKALKILKQLFISHLTIILVLSACTPAHKQSEKKTSVSEALSSQKNLNGFERATQIRPFTFPADRGPHPEFKTEWWYYTGNLDSAEGRHFGFQLTFFRSALTPREKKRTSSWATNQTYFAHFALSDIESKHFIHGEKWSRGGAGLAGAQSQPFRVWLENWKIVKEDNHVHLVANHNNHKIDLKLKPLKPRVLQGNQGLSQKSSEKGNASYYFSQTRLATSGTITINSQSIPVSGLSWLDREWSTSALSKEQQGWDWFSLQFEDGRELMLYQLRLKNGKVDPLSSGSLIMENGKKIHLKRSDFNIQSHQSWTSPHTQAVYPSKWTIQIPDHQLNLKISPWQADQELTQTTFNYWEGAVKVSGQNLSGNGYVELTGYDGGTHTR